MDTNIEPATGCLSTEDLIAPQLYTLDNGEYVPKMNILYPPETVFYVLQPDGSFNPVNDVIPVEAPSLPQEITLEYMIEKSTEFLIQNGYDVRPANTVDVVAEVPAQKQPVNRQEVSLRCAQLRQMVVSHFPSFVLQNAALGIIAELETLF